MTPVSLERRKYSNEIPWQCSWRSSHELSGPFVSKPHVFVCGSLTFLRSVRANVRLNSAIPIFLGVPEFRFLTLRVSHVVPACPFLPHPTPRQCASPKPRFHSGPSDLLWLVKERSLQGLWRLGGFWNRLWPLPPQEASRQNGTQNWLVLFHPNSLQTENKIYFGGQILCSCRYGAVLPVVSITDRLI